MTFGHDTTRAALAVDETAPSEASTPESTPKLRDLPVGDRYWPLFVQGLLGDRPLVTHFFNALLGEADGAIENAIGYVGVPLGVLPSLIMNGTEYVVPMATEEGSVIASASKAAKMCAATGGVTVHASSRPTVPVQIFYAAPPSGARWLQRRLFELTAEIEAYTNEHGGWMEARGGNPVSVGAAYLTGTNDGDVVLPMEIDTCDAMGANVVTRVAERVAEHLHRSFRVPQRTAAICSNDEAGWRVTASAIWHTSDPARNERLLQISDWAANDPRRAVTHVKGIMNGVSAVALATGQDTRAIEACAHASAIRNGIYRPLSHFGLCPTIDAACPKCVGGTLTLRIPCGTAGGATGLPFYRECLGILRNPNARTLASIMAAVGLVQNFAALWSLAGEGIPASHERLAHK